MLCACCSSASSLEVWTGIFSKSVTLWTALYILLWSKPHLVFRHKVYEIANGRDWSAASKSACLNCTNWTHFHLTMGRSHGNSCIAMLWVAWELLQILQHSMVRAFCRLHAYTFNEQCKIATALTPQADVTSEKVTWLMENPRQQSQPAYRRLNWLKTNINIFYFIKSQTSDSFVNHFDGHFAHLKTLDFSFKCIWWKCYASGKYYS